MIPLSLLSVQKKKRGETTSRNVAKERLELLLTADHMHSSPELMEQMKKEIQEVIRKYLNMDHVQINIQIELTNDIKQGAEYVKTIQIKRL